MLGRTFFEIYNLLKASMRAVHVVEHTMHSGLGLLLVLRGSESGRRRHLNNLHHPGHFIRMLYGKNMLKTYHIGTFAQPRMQICNCGRELTPGRFLCNPLLKPEECCALPTSTIIPTRPSCVSPIKGDTAGGRLICGALAVICKTGVYAECYFYPARLPAIWT